MGFEPPFTAQVESRNGVARVALSGQLDMTTVPILEDHLARFGDDGVGAIMLDLRDLTFVDSSGLHAFLQARDHAEKNGHQLLLVGASQPARRLFELTRTEFLLDEQEALSVLDQFTGSQARRAGHVVVTDVDAHV